MKKKKRPFLTAFAVQIQYSTWQSTTPQLMRLSCSSMEQGFTIISKKN